MDSIQRLLIANFVILTFVYCVYASLSGLYVDNGHQTVLQHQLTRAETHEVEHEILDLLGLADRPRRKRHIHPSLRWVDDALQMFARKFGEKKLLSLHSSTSFTLKFEIRRKSAPQFLLDIYKKLKLANESGGDEEEEGAGDDQSQPERVKRDVAENEIYLSPADQYAIDESDIIMTFLNKSEIDRCVFTFFFLFML